jgi:8-oxo-dGTP pyrophosphatase MutT (NUDIX family)
VPQVVTCILKNEEKILLLKRSHKVGTYRGLWSGVSGYIEKHEEPYETAVKEIQEELGITSEALELIWKGNPIEISDVHEGKSYDWIIHPFLFHIRSKNLVNLDWEHDEYRWIFPSEVKKFNTVPGLDQVIINLFGSHRFA